MTTAKGSRGIESGGIEASRRAKRRSWKRGGAKRIVEPALAPGASVAAVARAHEINPNLVFKWIRRSREGWRDGRCGAVERALRLSRGTDEALSFVPFVLLVRHRRA